MPLVKLEDIQAIALKYSSLIPLQNGELDTFQRSQHFANSRVKPRCIIDRLNHHNTATPVTSNHPYTTALTFISRISGGYLPKINGCLITNNSYLMVQEVLSLGNRSLPRLVLVEREEKADICSLYLAESAPSVPVSFSLKQNSGRWGFRKTMAPTSFAKDLVVFELEEVLGFSEVAALQQALD